MVYKPLYLAKMRRYPEKLIKKIKEYRVRNKLSFKELERIFHIPDTTIRNWCKGTVSNKWEYLIVRNERRRNSLKNSEISVVPKIDKINKKQAKFLASLLYGCEGAKYPATNRVAFSNSDPKLILTFLKLLKKGFDLDNNKFSIHLQIHSDQNFEELRKKWASILSMPETQFFKPTITTPRGRKHRDNYIGTCTLKYRDYIIQLKLLGIFEDFINQF